MNLPFAPDGVKQYAPVALVNGIENAGYSADDVNIVVPSDNGWLVQFHSNTDTLRIAP